MAACQGNEVKPLTEFIYAGITAKHDILMAHSMLSFPIKGRLVGHHHARKEYLRIVLRPYRLRTFMDTEIVSDSMSCAMAEIAMGLP